MANSFNYLFSLLVAVSIAAASRDDDINQILDDRKACQIDSPFLDRCMKRALEEAFPKIAKGIKPLNISPIDPLFVRETKTQYRRGISLLADGKVQNVRIYGLSRTQIKGVKTRISRTVFDIEVKAYVPKIFMEGLYEGVGSFGLIELNSKGYFNVTADGIAINSRAIGVLQTINGERYLRLTRLDLDPTITNMKMLATGIAPDPIINAGILSMINYFWPMFYRQMLPETKEIWEPILLNDINKFLIRLPIRRLLYYSYERHKLIIKS